MWLANQLTQDASATGPLVINHDPAAPLAPQSPLSNPKVKRVIYLHMIGAPSQLELFDYKPILKNYDGKDCPKSYLEGERFAFIQGTPQMLGPVYPIQQHGDSGAWISDRLPELSKHADKMTFIKTMKTDQFNHGPAQLMVQTGHPRLGYPAIGSWVTWGLGSENQNLPGFMVLLSGGRVPRVGKSLWGSGFLPSVYQGVQCRSFGDPVLNTRNPQGISAKSRRRTLDALQELNHETFTELADDETVTRIAQYEMAFRMQTSVPEVMSIDDEPESVHEMYGTKPGKESFANNCLLARRLAENGVRFIQLYDWGWDTHGSDKSEALNVGFINKCQCRSPLCSPTSNNGECLTTPSSSGAENSAEPRCRRIETVRKWPSPAEITIPTPLLFGWPAPGSGQVSLTAKPMKWATAPFPARRSTFATSTPPFFTSLGLMPRDFRFQDKA